MSYDPILEPDPDGPPYPFRVEEGMTQDKIRRIRRDIDYTLNASEGIIINRVVAYNKKSTYDQIGDLICDCRIHIWKSIINYEMMSHCKLSSYIYTCADLWCKWNKTHQNIVLRVDKRRKSNEKDYGEVYMPSDCGKASYKIEQIAFHFPKNAHKLLSGAELKCYLAYYNAKVGDTSKDISRRIGYASPVSYGTTLTKAAKKVSKIDILDYDLEFGR